MGLFEPKCGSRDVKVDERIARNSFGIVCPTLPSLGFYCCYGLVQTVRGADRIIRALADSKVSTDGRSRWMWPGLLELSFHRSTCECRVCFLEMIKRRHAESNEGAAVEGIQPLRMLVVDGDHRMHPFPMAEQGDFKTSLEILATFKNLGCWPDPTEEVPVSW